jgi:putative membrane protein
MLVARPQGRATAQCRQEATVSSFLLYLVVNALALYAASRLVSGIHVEIPTGLVLGALVLGLVNTFVRPIMQILSLPLTLLSLGLFYFVVNGLTFGLAAAFVPGFGVDGLWSAILGAIVVALVSWVAGGVTKGLVSKG